MVKFTSTQYELLLLEISKIKNTTDDVLKVAEWSLKAVKLSVQNLNEFIVDYTFKSKEEEIKFFKEIKPQFLKELIFYNEVYEIEAHKPFGSAEKLRQYFEAELHRLGLYFIRNQELYNYYRTDKSLFDELYFMREAINGIGIVENTVELDTRFSTVYSYRLSKLQGFEMVNEYLQKAIYKLDHPETFIEDGKQREFANLWTDSKVALIELAYALQARGSVNGGKGDIKQIITALEIIFNVELGNFYRTFQNMRIRKKNTTPFLDGLKESLERKMEQDY